MGQWDSGELTFAELAATTDADLVGGIRIAVERVAASWATYAADPTYPTRNNPIWWVTNRRGESIARSAHAMRQVANDDLIGAVTAARTILSEYFAGGWRPAERTVADAAEALRDAAVTIPALVLDAKAFIQNRQC